MSLFRLGVDIATAIDIFPDDSYIEGKKQIANEHRNKNGSYKRYIWGSYEKFGFGLTFVSISDTNQINEWYENNTVLTLFKNAQTPGDERFILNISRLNGGAKLTRRGCFVLNVSKLNLTTLGQSIDPLGYYSYTGLIIVNKSSPMDKHSPPYDTLYEGKIKLEGGFS